MAIDDWPLSPSCGSSLYFLSNVFTWKVSLCFSALKTQPKESNGRCDTFHYLVFVFIIFSHKIIWNKKADRLNLAAHGFTKFKIWSPLSVPLWGNWTQKFQIQTSVYVYMSYPLKIFFEFLSSSSEMWYI